MSQTPIRTIPLWSILAIGVSSLPCSAQFNGSSGTAAPPAMPSNGGINPAMVGGYGTGYGYGANPYSRQTPYEGYMNGAANITTANAQYQLTIQQAKQQREEARRSALQTRKATVEERQWELAQQPTMEDLRQKDLAYQLQRSRHNPPLTEIWSGSALNELFRAIKDGTSQGLNGPEVPLPYELLQHINLTTGTTYGGVGLLRDGGKLSWPAVLRQSNFDKERAQVDDEIKKAVKQAYSGDVDVGLLDSIGKSLKDLQQTIDSRVDDLSSTQFIQASRYVRELKSSYQVLQQTDVAKYFKPNWTAQGSTVADLVKQMTQQGLRFAPATSGDEPSYTSLHRALVDYDMGIARLAGGVARR